MNVEITIDELIESKNRNKLIQDYVVVVLGFTIMFVICMLSLFSLDYYSHEFKSKTNELREYYNLNYTYNKNNHLNITFMNMTEKQSEHLKSIISEVNEEYLSLVKSITFTKDQKFMNELSENNDSWVDTVGLNMNNHVYILVENDRETRTTICHELIHSALRGLNKEWEEYFAGDLGEKEVCYD